MAVKRPRARANPRTKRGRSERRLALFLSFLSGAVMILFAAYHATLPVDELEDRFLRGREADPHAWKTAAVGASLSTESLSGRGAVDKMRQNAQAQAEAEAEAAAEAVAREKRLAEAAEAAAAEAAAAAAAAAAEERRSREQRAPAAKGNPAEKGSPSTTHGVCIYVRACVRANSHAF